MKKIYVILAICFMLLLSGGTSAFALSSHLVASPGGTPNVAGNFISSDFGATYTNGSYHLFVISSGGFPFGTWNSYISTSLPIDSYTASSGGTPDISGSFVPSGTFGGYPYYTNGSYFLYSYPNPNYPGMFQPVSYCYASDTLGASSTDYFYYPGTCSSAHGFGHLVGQGSYSGNVDLTLGQTLPDNYFHFAGEQSGTYTAVGTYSGSVIVSEYVAPSLMSGLEATVADADTGFLAITGTTMGNTTNWVGDNFILLFIGSALAFLKSIIWWIIALIIIGAITLFARKNINYMGGGSRNTGSIFKGQGSKEKGENK